MNSSFWNGKRVLITGHTGFKGSWLCLWLQSVGALVAGYALPPPTRPSLYELAEVDDLIDSTIGDIRDLEALSRCLASFAPNVVFHMAAQSVVLKSHEDPVETYSTNVLGTVNVLEAIRRNGRPCTVVNVTTDKCYANQRWLWGYRENDELGGRDPYSNSKSCSELVTQAYRDSYFPLESIGRHGIGIASARAGNVIGGGDWTPHQLIPEAVVALSRGESVALRHPESVRPWQHVLDCLNGYLALGECLSSDAASYSGEWNFGPSTSDTHPVSYLADQLAKHWRVAVPWVRTSNELASEEREIRLDSSKANRLLRWHCQLDIDVALAWVAQWYQALNVGKQARELCLEQVATFSTRVHNDGHCIS
jgi:CDP-glucose 4,6-dehydratase